MSVEVAAPAAAAPADADAPMEDSSNSSPSDETGTASMETMETDDDDLEPIAELWCSGDAPDSPQQHNFEGVWKLQTSAVAASKRPVYEHHAPDNTAVYLYFVEQTAARPCPRWVIGPDPSGDGANGWAYSDSEAQRPEYIVESWNWWSKETSEWGEARLAFGAKGAAVSRDGDGDGDESDAEDVPGSTEGGAGGAGGAKKKKKGGKKKGGAKGGGGKAKKGGEGKGKGAAKAKAK